MDLRSQLQNSIGTGVQTSNNSVIQSIIQRTFLRTGGIIFASFAVGYYMLGMLKTGAIDQSTFMILMYVSIAITIGIIIIVAFFWSKVNYTTLAILGIVFAVAEGIGITGVLYVHSGASVINAFAGAALLFGLMALYGYITKKDLTKFGTILFIGLIAIIIMSIINIFLKSSGLEMFISIAGILIFLGLTAFDLQTLKLMAANGDKRLEIVFGISLYLNFINIFMFLLNLFGDRN